MLEIKNIVKQYAHHKALDDVSIHVPTGKIFGLLGPNGAGKTSLIRIINQITAPDSGQIYFKGEPLNSSHIGKIGYLPEERGLYKKMLIGDQMIYLAQLKGLSKQEAKEKIKYWFEKLKIESWWDKKVEDLSKGMQQKVQFVATVMHEPDLIILDEPFSGFDPVNAQVIQDEILELNKKGATIIYSTHRMESVEALCDNIALLNKSKVILEGSVKEIKDNYRNQTYKIEYSLKPETSNIQLDESLWQNLENEKNGGNTLTIQIPEGKSLNDVLVQLIPQIEIQQIFEIIPSMHDIFIDKVTK
ncbi:MULTISPECIES: ABC transporter ATP-binding protein [Sphingobacterium]|uniref:ABC transporter ATP-binding protein n=1 Tax=Sphingobacterium cellulitidis TaxID=1768011 RepID=A0A8H9G036_9SPHI|nr:MULTISPECIES: ABC transporter ATP-binding protein [Sphingobacterium]MBA8986545.1 ABC-2 type transport system ATP-binding protein [Sphingobacterium soli]OYD42577.1 ABC transporter ATP-binding protein [Sphingobacterium cellulitidis]OYD45188.1 ABC transporter ATP-binding protein [Sphingobacterium cellulitidis]WFB61895.1 ABC transporter ATP-binding protein [Sphingobacterium sp. WM]GGE21064.1 ABC transporter ATP-binding protein [Sphingobacterium soli]